MLFDSYFAGKHLRVRCLRQAFAPITPETTGRPELGKTGTTGLGWLAGFLHGGWSQSCQLAQLANQPASQQPASPAQPKVKAQSKANQSQANPPLPFTLDLSVLKALLYAFHSYSSILEWSYASKQASKPTMTDPASLHSIFHDYFIPFFFVCLAPRHFQ